MRLKKIILIVVDSLRSDHLGCCGYKRNTSPNLDLLTTEAVLFERAFSAISYTCPSFASMLTSLYPSKHSLGFHQKFPRFDRDKDLLLPEIMKSLGYSTSAFIGSVVLRNEVGLNSGFDVYDADISEVMIPAYKINKKLFDWLHNNYKNDFFTMIHYFDVHLPYKPPPLYKNQFVYDSYYGVPKYMDVVLDGWGSAKEIPQIGGIPKSAVLSNKEGAIERDSRYYIAQYDSCIRYIDNAVADIVNRLKELDIYNECMLIITSDHGEAMGENDVWFYHGITVTPDQIHVPLIIKPHEDWKIKSDVVKTHVGLIDIFPTISDLAGFDYSGLNIDGKSLLKLMENEKDEKLESRILIAEIEGQIAKIDRDKIRIEPKKVDNNKLVFFYVEELCKKSYIYSTINLQDADPLKFTGERYIPTIDSPEICYEHWHRYLYATQFVKGKEVLDIACGEGYGTHVLSQHAKRVVGIDINPEAVNNAGRRYINDNLEFKVGSVSNIPIEGRQMFDVVVSFETIDHIDGDEQKAFLKEIKKLLKPDGLFIVSTPNKLLYNDIPNYHNEFHIREFYIYEFKDFLNQHFSNVSLLGQIIYPVSYIWHPDKVEQQIKEYRVRYTDHAFSPSEESKDILYSIAICSDKPLEEIDASILVDISERIVKPKNQQIENLEAAIRQKDGQIAGLDAAIKEKDATIQFISSSHGWRLLNRYYKVRDHLLPPETKRRLFAKLILRLPRLMTKQNVKTYTYYLKTFGLKALLSRIMGSILIPHIFPQSALAHKYCIGKGLEIGGSAANPFGLNTLNADFTDSMDTIFKMQEIKLCGKAMPVDIIAGGDNIPLPEESQDFIVSSHVLEHFPNPIKALIEWDRLVRPGGIIFMIIPHKERTFDKDNPRTPLQHLIDDYNNNTTKPHVNPMGHDHCWITEDIVELVNWMMDNLKMRWDILEVQDIDDKVGNGFTIVIKKKKG